MKDMFRSRVLAAQAAVRMPQTDHKELNALERKVLRSKWWEKHHVEPDYKTRVRLHQNQCSEYERGDCYWNRPPQLALMHALAHHCVTYEEDTPFHGVEFAKMFLAITKRFLGDEIRASLMVAFVEHKVKFRTWSGAAKERAKQRYAKKDLASLLDELA